VFEVREFCLHDGPGVRTTVFFKGCPLRCAWCHNPEGQSFEIETLTHRDGRQVTCGVDWTAPALAEELLKNADIMAQSGGGVTFSGGEPLCQADFICEVIDRLSTNNQQPATNNKQPITFAIETSGCAPAVAYRKVVSKLDLVLQDVKFPDLEGYRIWTKIDATAIFANIAWLKTSGVPFVARIPTIPGVNDTAEAKDGIARLLAGAPNLVRVELLPYNVLAGSKYAKLGRVYSTGFDSKLPPDLSTDAFERYGIKAVPM